MSWGDNIKQKHKHHFRLLTLNINGLPQQRNHPKYGTLREQVANCQIDIIGMSEINLNWSKFSTYDRLPQRTSKWWENTHCSHAFNSHDVSSSKFQPGGTAILSRNLLSHKAQTTRISDPTGLGRWTSTLYQGQNNTLLRIIQLYRPCRPNHNSANGVYQQHSRFFLSKQITTCPRKQLFQDLKLFITHCLDNNEQIIVMGDFNDDITQPPVTSFFQSLSMHNLLLTLFHQHFHNSPFTYQRGTSIIDGIFATHGITAERGGYLDSLRFESDHRPIWVDIHLHKVFGSNTPPLTPLHCRRLKNEDPRTVQKFNSTYHKLLTHHNLHSSLLSLDASISHSLSSTQQTEYERIDHLRVKCLLQAEKHCRRLKTGNIDYSPTLQLQRNLIRFWKLILKRRKGQKIDTKYLSRWEKRLNLTHTFNTPTTTIKHHISTAMKRYNTLKKEHSSLRDEWIEQLAASKAEAGNTNSVQELLQLRQREHMRRAHRQIKWCLHKDDSTPPITEVTEIQNNITAHHSDKCTVETAIITANNRKYRQTNDTPPMTTLLPILGTFATTPQATQILQGTFQPPSHIDHYTTKLLKELQMPPHIRSIPPINISFTTSDYIQGWQKMNERTTSGLSKIHFGHHLACSKHPHNAFFEARMSSIPYKTGYSPSRYQSSINAMLQKNQKRKM